MKEGGREKGEREEREIERREEIENFSVNYANYILFIILIIIIIWSFITQIFLSDWAEVFYFIIRLVPYETSNF